MYLTPEKELYTIIQQFYSGKYADIAALDLNSEFDFSNILYNIEAHFYKIRAQLALNDFSSASSQLSILSQLISSNRVANKIDSQTSSLLEKDIQTLNAFIEFKSSQTINQEILDSIDNSTPSLALIYKSIILNTANQNTLSPELDLESYIFNLFTNSSFNNSQFKDLKSHYSDVLILDFAASWLGLAHSSTSTDDHDNDNDNLNAKHSYYFFEELTSSSNTDSIKNVINLLASHLKLNNLPEANDCLAKLETLDQSTAKNEWIYSLLINKIALASTTLNSSDRVHLIDQISTQFPNSSYVKDLNEKSQLFDSIVAEYV